MALLLNRITKNLDALTKSQAEVAKYFLYHIDEVAFQTLDVLAERIGVSTATIVRFSKEVGYDGFTDLQKDARITILNQSCHSEIPPVQESAPNPLLEDIFQMDIENLSSTLKFMPRDKLDDAIQLMKNAENLYVLGMRATFSMAFFSYISWGMLRSHVHLVQPVAAGYPECLSGISERDVCISFWAPRYNKMTASIMKWFRHRKGKVVLVAPPPLFDVTPYADILIPCQLKSYSFQNSLVAQMSIVNYLTQRLIEEVSPEETLETLSMSEELLGNDFYLGV